MTSGAVIDPNDPSIIITVMDDTTLTAQFELIPIWTLSLSSTAGGLVTTPGEGDYVYTDAEVVAVTAQVTHPLSHRFVQWTGTAVDAGSVANPSNLATTVTMTAAIRVSSVRPRMRSTKMLTRTAAFLGVCLETYHALTKSPPTVP